MTELKELLAKHHLVQTGKKDELVKRLVDNHVQADGSVANTGAAQEEELVRTALKLPGISEAVRTTADMAGRATCGGACACCRPYRDDSPGHRRRTSLLTSNTQTYTQAPC